MTRLGKKEERRNRSPRKHKAPAKKTGPLKDNLPEGFKLQKNALGQKANAFIGKVK